MKKEILTDRIQTYLDNNYAVPKKDIQALLERVEHYDTMLEKLYEYIDRLLERYIWLRNASDYDIEIWKHYDGMCSALKEVLYYILQLQPDQNQ